MFVLFDSALRLGQACTVKRVRSFYDELVLLPCNALHV